MQRLHQQRTDAANQGAEISVNRPRFVGWQVKATGFAFGNHFEPGWNAIGCSREQLAKLDRKVLLNPVVFVIQLANRFFRGQFAFEQEVVDRIVDAAVRPTVGGVTLTLVGD